MVKASSDSPSTMPVRLKDAQEAHAVRLRLFGVGQSGAAARRPAGARAPFRAMPGARTAISSMITNMATDHGPTGSLRGGPHRWCQELTTSPTV